MLGAMRGTLLVLLLASCSTSNPAPERDGGVALAEIGDPCTGNETCASGRCDLSYPYGLCYAACHTDADCGDVTMKLCGADGRCYLACRAEVDCQPGAATCTADLPARGDGMKLCKGVPMRPADGGTGEAAVDAPSADVATTDAAFD
jgi:hypothetical protein